MKKLYFLFILLATIDTKAQTYQWTNTFGGINDDAGYSTVTDPLGNVYVAGTCYNTGVDFDPSTDTAYLYYIYPYTNINFIAKYDAAGNYIWTKNVGAGTCFSMCIDNDNNLYVTGIYNDSIDLDPSPAAHYIYGDGSVDAFVGKYDDSGNFIWGYSIGADGDDQAYGIKTDNDNNVYLTGHFENTVDFDPASTVANLTSAGGYDCFLLKYDTYGNYKWALDIGGSSTQFGRSLVTDSQGNIFITGNFVGTVDFDPSPSTASLSSSTGLVFIAKYDSLGNYVWAKNIGGTRSHGFALDAQNKLCISGYFGSSGDFDPSTTVYTLTSHGANDIYFARYDTSGNFIWANNVGGAGDDYCYGLATDNLSNIYITGGFKNTVDFDPSSATVNATAVGSTNTDLFLSMYDNAGNFQWVKTSGNTGEDLGQSITLNLTGDIYLTGWFNSAVDFDPTSLLDNHTSNGGSDVFVTRYRNPTMDMFQIVNPGSFKIYPNPANHTLFCETSQNTQLYIYNSSGALVLNQPLNVGKHSLDVSFLSPGIYLVRSNQQQNGLVLIKQ